MERKIKVLRIIARLNIGGPAVHTILLTGGLNKDKFDSILVSGVVGDDEEDMLYLAEEKKIEPIIIPELGRKISFKNDFIAFWKLYRLIERESPDIIHTHTAKAGMLGRLAGILYNLGTGYWLPAWPAGRLVSNRKRCLLVHTFHGHVLHSYFSKAKTRVFIWIERFLTRFTDRIIAVSESVKKELSNLGIGNPNKLTVIPLGLELNRVLSLSPNVDSIVGVGIVGRLVPVKNHRMFLDTAKKLKTYNLTLKTKFFIIGDGELRNELKSYASKLALNGKVEFFGWHKDLADVYHNLDIVCLVSLNEGMPVSLIEAMAAAKAVVATDVGGVRDLLGGTQRRVVNGDSSFDITERGILVKSKDVQGFSGALRFLLQNSDIRLKMGAAGREFVRNNFTKERLINDMENLYLSLTKKRL